MARSSIEIAKEAVALAQSKGAKEAAAETVTERQVDVSVRDGKVEKISEATTRRLSVQLYVDGRYSAVSTSDLRSDALSVFLDNAIALTRALAPDPFRSLADPSLYKGQASVDLQLSDPAYSSLSAIDRRKAALAMEAAARSVKGAEAILSVTASTSDSLTERFRVHSNGFEGGSQETVFSPDVNVSIKDGDGRRPEDYEYAVRRYQNELPRLESIGQKAAERTLLRKGAKKIASGVMPMVIDHRSSGRFYSFLGRSLSGAALQQRRSFLEGKLDTQIASAVLDIEDDPLVPKGLGSRLFDGEGIAAKRIALFKGGVLKTYLIDTYYGKKLKVAPTTGSTSNLMWKLGDKPQETLIADVKEGIFVSRFLGGNSNDTTGDFSLGIQGFAIRAGKLAEPIAEMNISGSHLEVWKRLVAVGNDPYPYSAARAPTLVFDGIQVAGT